MNLLLPLLYFATGAVLDSFYHLNEKIISRLLLYFAVPIVLFGSIYTADLKQFSAYLSFVFITSIVVAIISRFTKGTAHEHYGKDVLSCVYGYFNIGWFGLPIADALYGTAGVKIAAAMYFGNMLFGNTIGYYLFAKEKFGLGGALFKIVKMPIFYSVGLGLLLNIGQIQLPFKNFADQLMVASGNIVTVLGMGLAGIGLSRSIKCRHVWGIAFEVAIKRFLIVMSVNTFLIIVFKLFLNDLNLRTDMLALLYVLPVAANVIAFAAELSHEIRSISAIVGASTIIAILALPVYCLIFKYIGSCLDK